MACVISVASGKGGVGKSVVSVNLALVLARMGKQVVLADLDVGGADAHVMVGLLNPLLTLTDFLNHRIEHLDDLAQRLSIDPNLRIIPGTGDTLSTANMTYAQKKRLIRNFQNIRADVIIVDIGAGASYHTLDFFLMADHHITVATPDPTSVLDLYRFIKLAAIRRVLSMFMMRDVMAEGLANRDYSSGTQLNGVCDLGCIGKRWSGEKCSFGQPGARLGTDGKAGCARRPRRRRRRRACDGRPP